MAGRTWLACAFGNQACRAGLSTRYYRLPLKGGSMRKVRGKRLAVPMVDAD